MVKLPLQGRGTNLKPAETGAGEAAQKRHRAVLPCLYRCAVPSGSVRSAPPELKKLTAQRSLPCLKLSDRGEEYHG